MGAFKKCPITKKMHNTKGKRCVLCERKRWKLWMRRFVKTKKGKAWVKRKMECQRKTLAKYAYLRVRAAIKYYGFPSASEFNCLDCGLRAEVYDHRDYTKPLEVDPVCKVCNSKRGPVFNMKVPDDFVMAL